jgi:hypothetical protein
VESRLLPKSGVGVVAPWLVIAPPGNPVIRLDLRQIDRVAPTEETEENEENEDADRGPRYSLLLACGELEVALYVADGREAVARLVSAAAPLTRFGKKSGAPAVPTQLERDVMTSDAYLVITSAGVAEHWHALSRDHTTIGRTDGNDLVIAHRSISRRHAEVTRDPTTGSYCIADLEASNGIRINGVAHASCALEHGDVIDLGHVRLRFESRGGLVFEDAGPVSLERLLIVGPDPVRFRNNFIEVGEMRFRLNEVKDYALHGANLPLPGGRLLQAAIALMVVAAGEAV